MTDPDSPHQWALRYAGLGLRVIPIKPGHKRPDIDAWQDKATTDKMTIDLWWTGHRANHGIGLALGLLDDLSATPTYIFAIDIDQHGIDGEDTISALEMDHGELPPTWEAATGGGGRHLIYRCSAEIRNGILGDGVDIRGAGGQIVVAPTIHPNGNPYRWAEGKAPWQHDLADAPQWVLDTLAAKPEPVRPISTATATGDRPGDLWAAKTTWAEILEPDGWTYVKTDHDGVEYWKSPLSSDDSEHSASVGYKGSESLHVFTSSMAPRGLNADESYSKLGYLAATRHNGDHSAAARALADQGYKTPAISLDSLIVTPSGEQTETLAPQPETEGWPILDIETIDAILNGDYEAPTPDLLDRDDGESLLYLGKVHSLAGEPGGGKTWLALHAVVQCLDAGLVAVWIDYEDRPDTAIRRLRQLGAAGYEIRSHFRYVTPTFGIKGGGVPQNVIDATEGAALVCIDSMGEALAHSELDQNSDSEVRGWMASTARRLADKGAAVLIIDHVTKDSEHRGKWAIGSQRKLAAIDGAAYQWNTITPATKTTTGKASIKVSKDRQGNYAAGSTVALVEMAPVGDDVVITLTAPPTSGDGPPLLTGYMERISRLLEDVEDGLSGRAVEGSIEGKAAHVRTALRQLEDLGHTTTESGPRGSVIHRSVKAFREVELLTASHRVPPRPHRVPDAVAASVPTASPPYGDAVELGGLTEGPKHGQRVPLGADDDLSWIEDF